MPTVQANGISVYYEIHGTGEPLVFIGGVSIDVTELQVIAFELSKNHEVIIFDNRGAGRTDKPEAPYSIEMMADDTFALLEALGIRRADVIGLSLGGRVAISLTTIHPDLVRSLILVSTGPKVSHTFGRHVFFALAEVPRRIGDLGKKYPQPHYAYKQQLKASEGYDATEELSRIGIPTLVMHGEKDRVVPYSVALDMHERIRGSKMVTFKGGHLFPFFHPKQFVEAVEDFLRRVP